MIILYYDLETTGLNHWEHGITQIAGFVEQTKPIGAYTSDLFNLKLNPNKLISDSALEFQGLSREDVANYPDQSIAFNNFIKFLSSLDSRERIHLCGYNNSHFDDHFLKQWFKDNNRDIREYFYTNSIDVMILASEYLKNVRRNMDSFSLMSVAKYLSINIDETKLHEATYDIQITKQIYDHIKGKPPLPEVWNWNELTEEEKDKHLTIKYKNDEKRQ